jgi:hypothetical protein
LTNGCLDERPFVSTGGKLQKKSNHQFKLKGLSKIKTMRFGFVLLLLLKEFVQNLPLKKEYLKVLQQF